jgi:hypothetical protein
MIVQIVDVYHVLWICSRENCGWKLFIIWERSDSSTDDHIGAWFPLCYSRFGERVERIDKGMVSGSILEIKTIHDGKAIRQ